MNLRIHVDNRIRTLFRSDFVVGALTNVNIMFMLEKKFSEKILVAARDDSTVVCFLEGIVKSVR